MSVDLYKPDTGSPKHSYASEEAMQTHIAGSDCQVFIKAMEAESLCENVKVIFHKPIVGVESRL